MNAERYLTVNEAAEVLGVSARSLRRWHAERLGPPRVKIGEGLRSTVRYRLGAIYEWMAANEQGAVR